MADSYWRYSDPRQPPSAAMTQIVGKRSRPDYDTSSSHGLAAYYPRDDDRGALRGIRDTESINASYDRYLRSTQLSSYGGEQSARALTGVIPSRTVEDPHMVGIGGVDPVATVKDRSLGFGSGRPEVPLPPDATSTLFVEGLPANCTRREVAHIFRPFVGYREVRLVSKESRHPGGDPLVLCFVDFVSPAHAATAMDALQVCRKWKVLASSNDLWSSLFKERWGEDHAAFYAPATSKSWKDVYEVQDRCDRVGLGLKIIREVGDYYLVHQGEIQQYLGSKKQRKGIHSFPSTGMKGEDIAGGSWEDQENCLGILDKILFFIGDLEVASTDAKRGRVL